MESQLEKKHNWLFNLFYSNKDILKLALPIFLELFLGIIIGYIDQFQMSFDQNAVNAIGQVNQITTVLNITYQVMTTASIILITQLKGKKNKEDEEKVYVLSFYLTLTLSLIFSFILFFLPQQFLSMMQVNDKDIMKKGIAYMQITGAWVVFQAMISTFGSFLRANKKMACSTIVTFTMNIINVSLNAVGIYAIAKGSSEGVLGISMVALSSTIARVIGLVIIVIMYIKFVGISLNPLPLLKKFPAKIFKKIIYIGVPSSLESFSYNMSQLVILILINGLFTQEAIQGNIRMYFSSVTSIIYLFASGVSQAMQVAIGEHLGRNDKEKAHKIILNTLKMALFVSFVMSIIVLSISYPLFSFLLRKSIEEGKVFKIFNATISIPIVCVILMSINIILEQGRALNSALVKALQSCGDIFTPVITSIISCWLFAVFSGTYILGHLAALGVIGVVIGNTLDECFRGLFFLYRLQKGRWKNIDLTRNLHQESDIEKSIT